MEPFVYRVAPSDQNQMSTKTSPLLFVGGLPLHACDTNLAKYFRQFGPLDYIEVDRLQNGKSKGTGYIQFVNPSDSRKAVNYAKVHEILGKPITLEIASLPESLNLEMKLRTNRKIFLGNIPNGTTKEAIYNLISRHARVERVTHLRTAAGNYTYCYAVLYNFADKQRLISKGHLLLENGSIIQVKQYIPKSSENKPHQSRTTLSKQQPSSLTDKAWYPDAPISPASTTRSQQAQRQEPVLADTTVAKIRPGLALTTSVSPIQQWPLAGFSMANTPKATLVLQRTSSTLPRESPDDNYRFNFAPKPRLLTVLL